MDVYSTVISIIKGIIAAAPDIAKAYGAVVNFIETLFGSKLITIEQQAELRANVDAAFKALLNGETPPQWTVEPDPS